MNRSQLSIKILVESREWLGTPYVHQASVKNAGCDCLGLVRGVWRHLYGCEPEALPSYTSDWGESDSVEHLLFAAQRHFKQVKNPTIGDIVLFRWQAGAAAKHLGIISSKNSFIHAYERSGVVETTFGPHWQKKSVATFRFPLKIKKK